MRIILGAFFLSTGLAALIDHAPPGGALAVFFGIVLIVWRLAP